MDQHGIGTDASIPQHMKNICDRSDKYYFFSQNFDYLHELQNIEYHCYLVNCTVFKVFLSKFFAQFMQQLLKDFLMF